MQRCQFIDEWVRESIQYFIPNGVYKDIRSSEDNLDSGCYVVHFPSKWAGDIDQLLKDLASSISPDGVFLMIEVAKDDIGNEMCHQADGYKALLRMHCVVNSIPYYGNIEALRGKTIVMYQFWHQSHQVFMDAWIEY